MNNKTQNIKNILMNLIRTQKQDTSGLVRNPHKDFSRERKLSYEKMILFLLTMEGTSLTNELLRQFGCNCYIASASAFVQQRNKLLPFALEKLFHDFVSETDETLAFNGLRLLAVDGSDIQIPTNMNDPDFLFKFEDGRKPYNLLHLNALYDMKAHTYADAVIYKPRVAGENKAFTEMVDRSKIPGNVLVIADRGYEAYNNMAHIQEKGWSYLIRIKDFSNYSSGILHGLELPVQDEFDVYIDLQLTRKQTNDVKELLSDKNHYRRIAHNKPFDYLPEKNRKSDAAVMYTVPFRVVRFQITEDSYEVIVTNLEKEKFPPEVLKRLYSMRWGIETAFRDLKSPLDCYIFIQKRWSIYSRKSMQDLSCTTSLN